MRKSTLNIIILTLCLINLILNVLMIFQVMPMATKTNKLMDKIAEVINLEIKPEWAEESSNLTIDQISSKVITTADGSTKLTVSIPSSDSKNHYVVTGIVVSLDTTHEDYEKLSPSFDNANSLIMGKAETVISSYTYETASASKAEMQQRILDEIRNLFQSNMIYDVSFQGFVVQ